MNITLSDINKIIVDSLFKRGGTIGEAEALRLIIAKCEQNNTPYTLSKSVAKIANRCVAANY